jgi:hypothetical protein
MKLVNKKRAGQTIHIGHFADVSFDAETGISDRHFLSGFAKEVCSIPEFSMYDDGTTDEDILAADKIIEGGEDIDEEFEDSLTNDEYDDDVIIESGERVSDGTHIEFAETIEDKKAAKVKAKAAAKR